MDRSLFRRGVDLVVAELGVDVVAGFGLVVDQQRGLVIRSHPIRDLLPQPVVKRVLAQQSGERTVTGRPHAFLRIPGDLLLGQGAFQRRDALGIQIDVLGKLFVSCHDSRYTRPTEAEESAMGASRHFGGDAPQTRCAYGIVKPIVWFSTTSWYAPGSTVNVPLALTSPWTTARFWVEKLSTTVFVSPALRWTRAKLASRFGGTSTALTG